MAGRARVADRRRMFRRGAEFWTAAIAELERSGLTHEMFARRRGLSAATLRSWIYRLRRKRKASVPLVPVRVVASTAPTARRSSESRTEIVEVELLSGALVRFAIGADVEYVAALVQRLR